jgi:hypothetical protein
MHFYFARATREKTITEFGSGKVGAMPQRLFDANSLVPFRHSLRARE